MFQAKTQYKTNNGKFLAIIKIFKIQKYYLKDCKYEILVFIDYNNLYQFVNIKNLTIIIFIEFKSTFVTIFK